MRAINKLFMVMGALSLVGCATGGNVMVKPLSVTERITIQAPADKVWGKVRNFGDLGAWHPAVAKTEIVTGANNQKGAVRLLTLGDGGQITETLTQYNVGNKSYSYVINNGVLPVSSYASTIQVVSMGDGAEVIWKGDFKRKDTSENPKEGQGDKAAVNTMTAVYKAGLENLKKITE